MQINWHKYLIIFFLAIAVTMAGILTTEQLARTQTNPQDDVQSTAVPGQIAPRLQNLGDHKFPVTTNSARAQLFINQAMMLVYGFNHAEATRSFREAARLDPNCAMAYWGMALVLGPNINMAMSPEAEPQAYELIQKAIALKKNVSEKEQAYIDALAVRYTGAEKPNRTVADRAYAEAMLEFHKLYPNDLDAATFYAEAIMDLRPWNYWTRDKQPYPETREVLRVLESVLERNPNHPGAIHLYIHAVEYARPEIAEAEAEKLWELAPGAGHLVHMPSHIFRRIGRYNDASKSNEDAIAADEDYITQCRAQGVYPLAYYPHNIHFLWDSATMEGRSRTAIEAARKAASKIPDGAWREVPLLHQFLVTPLFAYTRFGEWDLILSEPQPAQDSLFWTGVWHYARGIASTQEWQGRITQLHEGLGDVLALTGQHDQARSAFEEALSHVPGNDPIWQARLERKVGITWDTQRLLNHALKAYRLLKTTWIILILSTRRASSEFEVNYTAENTRYISLPSFTIYALPCLSVSLLFYLLCKNMYISVCDCQSC